MKDLDEKISQIKVGEKLDLRLSKAFDQIGLEVERLTDRAVLIDGQWLPKSQIIAVEKTNKYTVIYINDWWDQKTANQNWSNRGASGAY